MGHPTTYCTSLQVEERASKTQLQTMKIRSLQRSCFTSLLEGLWSIQYGYGTMAYDSSGDPMREYSYIGVAYCTGGAHIANTTLRPSTGSHYQYDYQTNEVIKKWTMQTSQTWIPL